MLLQASFNIKLRPPLLSDSDIIFQTIDNQREYLGKWLPFVEHTKNEQDTTSFLESIIEREKEQVEPFFVIEYDGHFCGIINCKNTDFVNKKTEIGYWLSKEYQKKGIMTLSVKAISQHIFSDFGMNRIVIKCATGNQSSQKVAIRAGYYLEGVEREGEKINLTDFRNLYVYSLLKKEFQPV